MTSRTTKAAPAPKAPRAKAATQAGGAAAESPSPTPDNQPSETEALMKPVKYIVMNNKGGVGKTTIAHFLVMAHDMAERVLRIIEVDEARKISEIYPGRVESLTISPAFQDLMSNGEAAIDHFMPLHLALRDDRPTLIDFGAAASKGFLETAELGDLGDEIGGGHNVIAVIVTTTDASALESASDIYRRVRKIFPFARVALVFNEKDGPFADVEKIEFFARLRADPAALLVKIPMIRNSLMTALYGGTNLPLDHIVSLDPREIASKLEIDISKAKINHRVLVDWVKTVLVQLKEVVPSPRELKTGEHASLN